MSNQAAGLRGRSAKIIATLGPGSSAPGTIRLLAEAGVDVFRLNFSHGEQEKHKLTYETIRRTEEMVGRPLAVLADLQGPKIRVGKFPDGALKLEMRGEYDLVVGAETDAPNTIAVPRKEILSVLEEGDTILADDGLLIFTVIQAGETPKVRSELPGVLKDRKGFTVRGKALPVPALSEKDRSDLAFALDMGVDIVALSFVQTVADIEEARGLIGDKAMIVAKLEKPAAIDDLEGIAQVCETEKLWFHVDAAYGGGAPRAASPWQWRRRAPAQFLHWSDHAVAERAPDARAVSADRPPALAADGMAGAPGAKAPAPPVLPRPAGHPASGPRGAVSDYLIRAEVARADVHVPATDISTRLTMGCQG
mgnify:CR=1 FL=1